MATAEEQLMTIVDEPDKPDLLTQLSLSLGQVRAEYSPDATIFAGFSWPVYWGELVGPRPCVLVGGRGTGKTTTLRGLAYGGQYALRGAELAQWDTIGAYWRIDSMVVSAFTGRGIPEEDWIPAFSHYANLKMVSLFLGFCTWRNKRLGSQTLVDPESLALTAISLNLPEARDLDELAMGVRHGLAGLEARLNGATNTLMLTPFSALGRPLAYLLDGVSAEDDVARLPFTFCIDEFENLRPYQQRILNTLVKHVGDSRYTIKLGVRASEQRVRDTLAPDQTLMDPADYTTVDIVQHLKDQSFAVFASQVCEKRLAGTDLADMQMSTMFPSLSIEREAELLGAERFRARTRDQLAAERPGPGELATFDAMPLLEACLVGYWAKSQAMSRRAVLAEAASDRRAWEQRVGNYAYAFLFTLRQGLRGTRKYYAGWSTYCQLANGNIRLLLELVYEALRTHVADTEAVDSPVSFEHQTIAASQVGQATLREIQGQSGIGGQLTRLTLSLGRIFNVFAAAPEGHTPEVNQIRIDADNLVNAPRELETLIQEAVANGCLISFAGNKQGLISAETKSPDYHLHPIFAPYFVYSHRRKRRIHLRPDEVLALSTENAARTINDILKTRRRPAVNLPEQLEFYSEFYNAAD